MADPIIESWKMNAQAWISTIEGNELESRKLVTNRAIVEAVLKYHPARVLDVGCGEGWLCRTLSQLGTTTLGVDAVADFVQYARTQGKGLFERMTYQDLIQGKPLPLSPFVAVVINFALLDKEPAEQLLTALPRYLTAGGKLIIQTLHPGTFIGKQSYQSGWRTEDWQLMKQPFTQPYRWYFRTLEDWIALFAKSGYWLLELSEPIHPKNRQPLSVIFGLQHPA